MASRADIMAKLGLDSSGFKNGLKKAQHNVKSFTSGALSKFGALAGVAGIGGLARAAIDLGSKISDMAVQLNIGTTELQTLEFAAREAGVEVGVMERALRNVQLRTQEAINGNKSYSEAFQRLGIDINEFNKLPTEGKLEAIAQAQAAATDQAAAYNDVAIILGQRAGPAMQEILQKLAGPDGFKGVEDAAKSSGEVMDEETIAKMDLAADRIESFKRKATVMAGTLLTKIVPAFKILSNGLLFVGDALGAGAANFIAFGSAVGRVLSAVVAPAISQMEALGLAIKAAGQAASRDFDGAKDSLKAAKNAAGEVVDEMKAIPSEIAGAFQELKDSQESVMNVLGESIEKRAGDIGDAWSEMTGGMVDDAKEANKEIENKAPIIAGTTKPAGADAAGGVTTQEVVKKAVELAKATQPKGIQTRGIRDSRKIGSGPSAAFLQKERDLGMYNTTLGRDLPKAFPAPSGMKAKAQDEKADSKNLESMREDMSAIRQEMTRT